MGDGRAVGVGVDEPVVLRDGLPGLGVRLEPGAERADDRVRDAGGRDGDGLVRDAGYVVELSFTVALYYGGVGEDGRNGGHEWADDNVGGRNV